VAPRPYWKGHLQLSLVFCPIQLFPATSERAKIRLHQVHRKTGNRVRYCKCDAVTGQEVAPDDVVMAYEIGKGRYVEVTDDEVAAIALDSTHTIQIDQFAPRQEIDDLFLGNPYYITPDGEIGREAYDVIQEAIKKENVVALGRVTFTTREHVIAIEPRGKGLLGVTLRYPYEVRREEDYFGDLPEQKVPKEMLNLATHIIATRRGHFDPNKFEDHYETSLRELIKRKQRGETIEKPKTRISGEVINLTDALRKSVAAERGSKRVNQKAAGRRHRPSAKRSSARARQAG
jgi:DNA end-binding protein Ku